MCIRVDNLGTHLWLQLHNMRFTQLDFKLKGLVDVLDYYKRYNSCLDGSA